MKLAQYLMTPVVSLEDRQKLKIDKAPTPARKKPPYKSVDNKNRHNEALNRYKEAMGKDWKSTEKITEAVNLLNEERGFRKIANSFTTLFKWEKDGIVEHRIIDEKQMRRARYEWRWVK